jgi:hypothetical protein
MIKIYNHAIGTMNNAIPINAVQLPLLLHQQKIVNYLNQIAL